MSFSFSRFTIYGGLVNDFTEDAIRARLARFIEGEDDAPVAFSDMTISRAASILQFLAASHRVFDYAFGEDGSIGIYSQHVTMTEYIDILNDERIRYFLRDGYENEQKVFSPEEAIAFVSRYTLLSSNLSLRSDMAESTNFLITPTPQSGCIALSYA
jgi:hypothetical protein